MNMIRFKVGDIIHNAITNETCRVLELKKNHYFVDVIDADGTSTGAGYMSIRESQEFEIVE